MGYDSAAVLTPEAPETTSPPITATIPSPERSALPDANLIRNAIFEANGPVESAKLSPVTLGLITVAGLVITVALVMGLAWLLR